MSDSAPSVKNPSRVPGILQAHDPVGEATGGVGATITPSMLFPAPGQQIGQEQSMSDRTDLIDEDGVYEDAQKNRFQFRKDHRVGPGEKKGLKKVAPFPVLGNPGEAELEATKAKPETAAERKAREKAEAELAAKAAEQPENKAEPEPENKS